MDFLLLCFAFICGLAVKMIGLPPLIGYLAAGFGLHALGVTPDASLDTLADLGITLMLFTIGLKLNAGDLVKREVWAGTLAHMSLWVLLGLGLFLVLALFALPLFAGLDATTSALLAFAFSFSSTVCIVKLLEESGEMRTRHGRLAIGVLVMQDIVAVLFLATATGKLPAPWALLLLGLPLVRPLLGRLLDRAGHGELLPLTGLFFALGGYELFNLVGIKGDLGALVVGVLLSRHAKAVELSKTLMNFKDLFLIGFFLSIGFTALPSWSMLGIAAGLTLLLPLKFLLFLALFLRLGMRGHTAFLGALALTNYSEFGLIVASLSVDAGWLAEQWLVVLALAVSFSFILTSLLYRNAHDLYLARRSLLTRFERTPPLAEDRITGPERAGVLVIGLGRIGISTYRALHGRLGKDVWGMDADAERVERLAGRGWNIFQGDAEDADLWSSMDLSATRLVLLAVPTVEDCRNVTAQLKQAGFDGQLLALARYTDETEQLLAAGIDRVYNFYAEAGNGFAEESLRLISADQALPEAGGKP